ncbi:MAG: PilZ domain-containing protein [Myxococcota bacterium]
MSTNKRSHIRILVALKVTAESETGRVKALTKNLSVGGVYLLTDAKWAAGTTVELNLEHKGVEVHMRAEVTHRRDDGLGLRFVDPPPVAVTELIGVIDDILSSGVDLDGAMLVADERLVLFRRGMLEYVGRVDKAGEGVIAIETPEKLRKGEPLLVLLPARSDGAHVREIVGSFAEVMSPVNTGFTARFIDASDEFMTALNRVAQ